MNYGLFSVIYNLFLPLITEFQVQCLHSQIVTKMDFELKSLTLSDHKDIIELFTNQEVLKSYSNPPILNEERVFTFIERLTSMGVGHGKFLMQKNSRIVYGICSLHDYDQVNKSIEIGGTLYPKYWGKGIMLQVFKSLIDYAILNFELKQIVGNTLPTNKKSNQISRKLGFKKQPTQANKTLLIKKRLLIYLFYLKAVRLFSALP